MTEMTNKEIINYITKTKWQVLDAVDDLRFKGCDITCQICGHKEKRENLRKLVSQCRFNGGRLERYECPVCGVIFGPLKFLYLNDSEIADEYNCLYMFFSEADNTQNEIRTFHSLKPKKDGIYLNYGCGNWSKSVEQLRKQGWNVYGYEPFVQVPGAGSYILKDAGQLQKMRFDGLFTNNLIEHLKYPVETFQQFKKLLKNESSTMAHSTPCYRYCYEYTRFHLHFFTGRSIDYLCARTGLKVIEKIAGNIPNYINYVYGINKEQGSVL